MIRLPSLRRIGEDQRGATVLEFGLIFVPLCILLMGGMDIAYQVYVRTVVAGSMEAAARSTTVEAANETSIENTLRAAVLTVIPTATVKVERDRFYNYAQINTLERLTKDSNGNNVLDIGDCWEDVDNNGIRNTVTKGQEGIGSADDIVRYDVTAEYKRILPIYGFIGLDPIASVSASTLVKRQPYAGQASPPTACRNT